VVLVSVGMHDKGAFFSSKHLPIVSYDLFLINPDGTIAGKRLMTFSGEPRPEVYFNLAGHLDNGKYGFIHVTELPAGKYLLAGGGMDRRAMPMPSYGGGVMVVPGTSGSPFYQYFVFDVKARHLNYAGEILTVSLGGAEINDQFERDFKFCANKKAELNQLPVVKQLALRAMPKDK